MKKVLTSLLLTMSMTMSAQSTYDLQQPFGFATVSSRTENTPYNLTGGGAYTYPAEGQYVVTASGRDDDTDRNAISNAIADHDIVILDGSNGPFIITQTMSIDNMHNKTILGINNARLCTKFYITDGITQALNDAGVSGKSSSAENSTGGTINGEKIKEDREYYTRLTVINYTGDTDENYRKSGIFKFSGACSNIIIRNIQFEGPGPIDCAGNDLMWINSASTHMWVDHCNFIDGMDGNFDISNGSDFITVSWCRFYYTDRAYDHMNSNLVGGSDSNDDVDRGKLNVTFAYNNWGTRAKQRMPMARFGKIHMLNNYYTCTGNDVCINPRKNSEFLIEGNYFDESVSNVFNQKDATAWVWSSSSENIIASGASTPSSSGSCSVPYTYSTSMAASIVPTEVGTYAGNVLYRNNSEPINPDPDPDPDPDPETDPETAPETGTTGAITWVFDTGVEGQTATIDSEVADMVKSTQVELGSNLSYNGTQEMMLSNASFSPKEYSTKIQQEVASSTANENLAIKFLIKPKTGVTFTPKSVSFRATRCGTDGGKMTIQWYDENVATPVDLGTTAASKTGDGSTDPARDNNQIQNWTDYSFDLTEKGAVATTGECGLKIMLYNATGTNKKSYAYGNIVITGSFSGSNTTELSLGQNGYSTYAGEYNFTIDGEGVGAYTIDYDSEHKKVKLTPCAADAIIEKGAGIILKGEKKDDPVTITYTDEQATVSQTGLKGVISSTTSISSNPYVLASKGAETAFVKAGTYGTVEALMNKAYLDGEENNLQAMPITLDETTAIGNVNGNDNGNGNVNDKTKVIRNGRLYIGNYNVVGARIK